MDQPHRPLLLVDGEEAGDLEGVQLLERFHSGSRLTAAGKATVEWARPLLDGMRSLIASVATIVMAGLQSARVSNASRAAHHQLVLHAHRLRQLLPAP